MELSELLFSGIGIAALVFFLIFVITSYVLIKYANRTEQNKKLDSMDEKLDDIGHKMDVLIDSIQSLLTEIRSDREARKNKFTLEG